MKTKRSGRIAALLSLILLHSSLIQGADKFLNVRLDTQGPYLILATPAATLEYAAVIRIARQLHPQAVLEPLTLDDPAAIRRILKSRRPYYALVFIKPEELDANFVWEWLERVSEVDEDPFVDCCTGFVTGDSPTAVLAFMNRIAEAISGKLRLPAGFIDNLGPNAMAAKEAFSKTPGSFMVPVLASKWTVATISHGRQGFSVSRLNEMDGAGIVHFGGHGYPDRVVDCLNGPFARKLKLAPSVVSSGACYTGVTSRWFDVTSGKVVVGRVDPRLSFCLGILTRQAVAYLAALHADHGIPVYQELEYMAYSGASLGNVIKHTWDGVMLASGGRKKVWEPLRPGQVTSGSPEDFMLRGTASRLLFGDPSLIVTDAITDPPFDVKVRTIAPSELEVKAEMKNPLLFTTFGDTYFSDMSQTGQFNDRALIDCLLPKGWDTVKNVRVKGVSVGGSPLQYRLIGFAVEKDREKNRLWIQVDLPSSGYMQSSFRSYNSRVELRVIR